MAHFVRRWGRNHYSHRLALEMLESRIMLSGDPPRVTAVEVGGTDWTSAFIAHLRSTGQGVNGYAIPEGSMAQSAALPWTNLDQIFISFSKDVEVQSSDLSLSGINVTAYTFSGFHYDPQTFVARWTLSAPLEVDWLRIDLDANGMDPVRDLEGALLDGEWQQNVSSISGDGEAGGDFEFTFAVLPTDVNNSGNVTNYDYLLIKQLSEKSIGNIGYQAKKDINGDGSINATDWEEALDRAFEAMPAGVPAGVFDDAPTVEAMGLYRLNLENTSAVIPILTQFGDFELGSEGLTYSIVSNSNESLVEAWIDGTTQELYVSMVNPSSSLEGRATVVVRGTDSTGLLVEQLVTIDVNRENEAPTIFDFQVLEAGLATYIVSGYVQDPDDDISTFIVNFSGVFVTRAAVDEAGYFEFAVILDGYSTGVEYAVTYDPHGLESNIPLFPLLLT